MLVAVMLLAAPEEPKTTTAPTAATAAPTAKKKDWSQTAALGGFGAAAVAAGFAAAIPFSTPGARVSDVPLALGITAFALVAIVRPFAFFGAQSAGQPPSTSSRVLRVTGMGAALAGLGFFIASLLLQANHSSDATGAFAATAGLEALSMTAFSADAAEAGSP
jgi:hypothetical protein